MRATPRLAVALALLTAAILLDSPATSVAVSQASSSQVQLVLPLRVDEPGLERFTLEVSTPASPRYHHYASIATLSRRFGASPTTRSRVVSWLKAHHARDVRVDATGDLAEATMDSATARRLFVSPRSARVAAGSTSSGPVVPAELRGAADGVFGVDREHLPLAGELELPQAGVPAAADSGQPSSELPRTGTPSGCAAGQSAGETGGDPTTAAFTPNQYLDAYDFSAFYTNGLLGQGQRVALIDTDGVKSSDVRAFTDCFAPGARIPPITQHAVGINHLPPPGGEATLDAEVLTAAAPGLAGIDVYETKPYIADVLKALTAPLQRRRNHPEVISVSIGSCEPVVRKALGKSGLKASQYALEAATSSGVTVVAASGDTGSAGCQRRAGPPVRRLAVLYPASSWFVLGVGGTNLYLTAQNQIADEVVWNDADLHLGAGGGGLSKIWTRPGPQAAVVNVNERAVPDVAMLADVRPGYAIYCTTRDCRRSSPASPWLRAGGTSAAAPLLAGGLALVDQVLKVRHQEYLGYVAPLLYAAADYFGQSFHDVTRIGNDVGPFLPGGDPLGCCRAHAGYDDASGLGSVDVGQLANVALQAEPHYLGAISARVPHHQHPAAHNRLLVRITCSQACHAVVDVAVAIGKSRQFELYSSAISLPQGGSRTVRLRFTAAELGRLRRALHHQVRVSAEAYGVITDSHGKFEKYSAPVPFTIKS